MQKYRSNAEPFVQNEADAVSDFDKLLENNTNDDNNVSESATSSTTPPKKAVKKKPVRPSLPMKFKITKVI